MYKKILIALIIFVLSIDQSINTIYLTEEKINNNNNIKLFYEEKNDLYGVIRIDKINLKRGFYDINHKLNKVSKNIELVYKDKNTLILASHSGNYYNAYFNDLDKLEIGDLINIDINNVSKRYELAYSYLEDKDGNLRIKYDDKRESLILITCSKKDKNKQVIYVSYVK